jgi:uncharacterized DUF497 family protein
MGRSQGAVQRREAWGHLHGGVLGVHNPLAVIFGDEAHSDKEPREIMVGHSAEGRLLVVSFTERGQAIRIISARQATQRERKDHERHPIG